MEEYKLNDNNEIVQVTTQIFETPVSSKDIENQIAYLQEKLAQIKALEKQVQAVEPVEEPVKPAEEPTETTE